MLKDKLKGCLMYGAIGDSIGGRYEGLPFNNEVSFDFDWTISDDTQLTLSTCEAIHLESNISAEKVAANFLRWYNGKKLSGLGASTLKAMRELQVGGHWALVGRSGEFAAGNGAAMRIAPLAFKESITLQNLRDICSITHKNDEAYVGALSVFYAIQMAHQSKWLGKGDLIEMIIDKLPDTQVKDRLIQLNSLKHQTIIEVGKKFKPTGYVVDSVPLAIFAAQKINGTDIQTIFTELVTAGGDTDTTCSMTGQIIGTLLGCNEVPIEWLNKYHTLGIDDLIDNIVTNWKK